MRNRPVLWLLVSLGALAATGSMLWIMVLVLKYGAATIIEPDVPVLVAETILWSAWGVFALVAFGIAVRDVIESVRRDHEGK